MNKKNSKTKKILVTAVVLVAAVYFCYLAVNFLFPVRHLDLIKKYAGEYGLEPKLVCAVIHSESRFNIDAISTEGASGLMQIVKQTADWAADEIGIDGYSYERIHEPEINIRIGCWYLSKLILQFGVTDTALAAYNAGSGNVSKWLENEKYSADKTTLSVIPYTETKNYIAKIHRSIPIYGFLLDYFGGMNEK